MVGLAGYGVFFATWISLAILAPAILERWYSLWGMLPIGSGTVFVLANGIFPYLVAFVLCQVMINRGMIQCESKRPGVTHLLVVLMPALIFVLALSFEYALA